jgi:hypothetical protein
MAKKEKTLCKWRREDIEKDLDAVRTMVGKPKVICKRCGRAVAKRKWVCKPEPLDGKS